jgi:hypothetical protein
MTCTLQSLNRDVQPGQVGFQNARQCSRLDERNIPAPLLDFHQGRVIPAEVVGHTRGYGTDGQFKRFSLRYQHREQRGVSLIPERSQ